MKNKVKKLIRKYKIDLSGLKILTEAASGAYLFNPFIAVLSGAEKVICKIKSSNYGSSTEVIKSIDSLAQSWGCRNQIVVKENLSSEDYHQADILTNSGHLRPITEGKVKLLKKTAVISLMWETWEYRESDLDLKACKENNILVLGTNEIEPPCDMRKYAAMIGVKLLLETGLEIAGNDIVILGSTEPLCGSIKKTLEFLGAKVYWFSSKKIEGSFCYSDLENFLHNKAGGIDGILFSEHYYPDQIIGEKGVIDFFTIYQLNPEIKIAVSCGNLNEEELVKSGIYYFPKNIKSFGHMTYQSYHVGPLPVMDLFAAGLKVGEVMARARLQKMTIEDAVKYAIKHSPAQDFQGELAWI